MLTKSQLDKMIALATRNVDATRAAVDAACAEAPDSLWALFVEDRSVMSNPTSADITTAEAQAAYVEAKRVLSGLQYFQARSVVVKVARVPTHKVN